MAPLLLLLVAAAKEGLLVYRTADDGSAVRIGLLENIGKQQAQAIGTAGGNVIVGYGASGMALVDLSRPESPRARSRIALPRSYPVQRVAVDGNLAYVACDTAGLAIVDLTAPDAPEVLLPRDRRMRISFP